MLQDFESSLVMGAGSIMGHSLTPENISIQWERNSHDNITYHKYFHSNHLVLVEET